MAKNSRTCEKCGGKASPHIPRQRVNGRLLCSGCANAESHKMTTASKGPAMGDGKAKKKPQAPKPAFDNWEGELAPEGHHPLASPLPNSIWEKFAAHRALMGKDPMTPEHYKEAEDRGAATAAGDSDPFPGSRAEAEQKKQKKAVKTAAEGHGAANLKPGPQLIQHLQEHHGVAPAPAMIQGGSVLPHHKMHGEGADHTHGPNGEVIPAKTGPQEGDHPHHSEMNEEQVKQHLIEHHGIPESSGSLMTGLKDMQETHGLDHEADEQDYHQLTHSHAPAPAAKSKEMPHPIGSEDLKNHLLEHHGVGDWEMEGMTHHDYQDTHDSFHESTAYSGADKPDHTHAEGMATAETVAQTVPNAPAKTMGGKTLVQHLKNEHGMSTKEIHKAFKSGGDKPTDGGVGAAQEWHDAAHASGEAHAHGHEHKEFGADGPETLKHPSKFTNSSMHTHLLTDHGIDPDHMANAIDGTFEATDPSHVVHMLHNAAHKNGQAVYEHSHEGWNGAPEIHKGHTDVGKPFWGAPPSTASKSIDHLMAPKADGGHGMSPGKISEHLPSHVDPWDPDDAHQEAYDNLHGNLHEHGGDEINHQHVPTIQPNVLSPAKVKKEKLKQHLKDEHGIAYSTNPELDHGNAHDTEAWANTGHPGHEHPAWDKHGPITKALPKTSPEDHPASMSHTELIDHLESHKTGLSNFGEETDTTKGKTHEELLQQHALEHASGGHYPHTHSANGPVDPLMNANNGPEPEIQTDTHPAIDNDSDAISHIVKHHPNVSQKDYQSWGKSYQGTKPSVKAYHDALHQGGKDGNGYKLPPVQDGHDHEEPSGPPTQIAVGSHLVHEHGMSQDQVASMTPAEFKAHHEKLHLKDSELDVGHGHDYPGGPMRDPRTNLPNTHHQLMRDDDKHPAVNEWYHGTSTDFAGAPKNATELKEDHGFWGNFGGGDWNNHVGTHWTSLHEMARNFNNGGNRVIHAKLHMSNPVTYNSLNHMAHDAYERLRASGHMQDDGEFEGNHGDDNGYNECCSGRLLEYAKGHHRDDGKFGLEAYRDSLRASGHDGIHVRNHADNPSGHWNAIPLSADQVEVTHGGCRGYHNDERDNDKDEFNGNTGQTKKGWQHPKDYDPEQYVGTRLDHLPGNVEVAEAHANKGQQKPRFKTAEGRGDSDPYLNGRRFGDDGEGEKWCDHCDDYADHESDDCDVSKWCNVCDDHGDHESSAHPYCNHCDDYADHESGEHEDEYGEHPDHMRKEGFCPHCNQSSKENYNSSECVNCGEDLPDWGKLAAHGKAVEPGSYAEDGETDAVAYGHASGAKMHPNTKDGAEVAAHLYHHHKSDVAGPAFDTDGEWDTEALNHHHQYLHQNADEAKGKGFEVDHSHKQLFGQFPKKMTPEETHAHLMLSHAGSNAGAAQAETGKIGKLTPQEAVEHHKMLHDADDAVSWGEKDSEGNLKKKANHTHDLDGNESAFDAEFHPKGDDLITHLKDSSAHVSSMPQSWEGILQGSPKTAKALHNQMHSNYGPSAEPGVSKYHVHTPEMLQDLKHHAEIKKHLIDDHKAPEADHQIKQASSLADIMKLHHTEHISSFPSFPDPDHTHFGGTAHQNPEGHTAKTMTKNAAPEEQKQHIPLSGANHWDPNGILGHVSEHHKDHPKMTEMMDNIMDEPPYGQPSAKLNEQAQEMYEEHAKLHGPDGPGHPEHYHFDHENKSKPAEGKTASRRTLSDLFEEVAL